MARQIALGINIKVNGTDQAINSIQDLENTIADLSNELKTTDLGSDRFQEIVGDLATLKAGFRDVNREIEGVDRTQQFELFASSVNGVTGAFLVATSAARAFSSEGKTSEELQKLQARALDLVNLALGVRQVLEAGVKFELLQRTITEKAALLQTRALTAAQAAYTAVVGTTTGALRALRIALAATGVGAVVVLLGTLIAKLTETKDETEEVAEGFKSLAEFQDEAAKSAGVEILKLQQLTKVLKDGNTTLKGKEEAYKELQKLVPELSNLTLEQAENEGLLNQAIEDQIALIQLRATATALESYLVELEKQNIALEREKETAETLTKTLEEQNRIREVAVQILKGGGAATLEQAEAQARLQLGIEETNDTQTESERISQQLLEVQQRIFDLQGRVTKRTKEQTDATKEQTEADKKAVDALKERIKAFNDAVKAFSQFNLEGEVSVKVLEEANKLIEKQTELLNERKQVLQEQTTESEALSEEINRLIGGIIIPSEGIVDSFDDVFQKIFTSVIDLGGSAEEQYDTLVAKVNELGGAEEIRKQIGGESLLILQDFFQTNIELQDLLLEYNEKAIAANQTQINQNTDISKLVKDIAGIRENAFETLERESVTEEKIFNTVASRLFPQTQLNNLTDEQKTTIDEITKSLVDQSELYVGIDQVNKELADKTKEIAENIKLQTQSLDDDSFSNLRQFIIDNADSIDAIKETFSNITEESSNLTQEQIDNINQLIEDVELNNLVDKINAVSQAILSVFNQLSGQISSIVSQQNSLLLEQLAYQEEQTLATIGDATEEARQEQERVRKEFAEQRFNIEKRARISELQFSLADSIANGAAAVISALTVAPPAGFLLANIVGAITAAQIATINSQIAFTKGKQFIARRGGLLQGNSHENGGIMANGGLVLEGGEAIINRNAVSQFSDILSQMSMSTGGRPLAGDDSRIVEEIRRQNQRPIKTYVLDSDIQEARKINQRLDEISRL